MQDKKASKLAERPSRHSIASTFNACQTETKCHAPVKVAEPMQDENADAVH